MRASHLNDRSNVFCFVFFFLVELEKASFFLIFCFVRLVFFWFSFHPSLSAAWSCLFNDFQLSVWPPGDALSETPAAQMQYRCGADAMQMVKHFRPQASKSLLKKMP